MTATGTPPLPPPPPPSEAALAVRGVTFDLDDTLWCGQTVMRKANMSFHAYLEREAPALTAKFSEADFFALMGRFQRELPEHAHDYTFLRKHALRYCVEACGAQELQLQDAPQLERFVEEAFRAFLVPRSQPELFGGVPELLLQLEAELQRASAGEGAGAPLLGVITNGNTEFANLPAFFQSHMAFVISAELVGTAKPDQRIFEAALAKFPATYSRRSLVHVGDHYECDVEGAKRAGMRTIWVNAKWEQPDALSRADLKPEDAQRFAAADAIVKDVSAVLGVVLRWNAEAREQRSQE